MARLLYLDTARLGPISPTALRLHTEFVRLAAEQPASLYCEDFIRHGAEAASKLVQQFPDLSLWQGIDEFKRTAATKLIGPDCETVLTSRSANMMAMAAGILKIRCRRILVTDLIWPPYLRILRRACRNSGTDIHVVSLRRQVYEEQMTHNVLLQTVADNFRRHHCDGLFLTAIDHCGARFPVATLLQHLSSEVRCSVVDASQAFGHVPTQDLATADFIFGSTHKWLGSYFPLCLGFAANELTPGNLRSIIDNAPTDPLLSLAESWMGKTNRMPKETINLGSLFSARGALLDHRHMPLQSNRVFVQGHNHGDWNLLRTSQQLSSHIILLRTRSSKTQQLSPNTQRQLFQSLGFAVTTYMGGFVRISVPHHQDSDSVLSGFEQSWNECFR